jgi:holo-[acyl-carrier protein] synthase
LDLELAVALIGVGIDLVDTAEAARLLERWGDRLLNRLLTEAERGYVTRAPIPAQNLAVRLAAKEAVYKALQSLPGSRTIRWRQIEVVRQDGGRPVIRLHAEADQVASRGGVVRIALSLTHTVRTAGAVAIVEGA